MASELTPEQEKFLQECDREFKDRFTDKDEEFKRHCDRAVNPPPILDDWTNRQSNRGYNNRGRYNNYNNRGGGDRYNDQRYRQYSSYQSRNRY